MLTVGGTLAFGPAAFAETEAPAAQSQQAAQSPATDASGTSGGDSVGSADPAAPEGVPEADTDVGTGDPAIEAPADPAPPAQDPAVQDPQAPAAPEPAAETGTESTATEPAAAMLTAKVASVSAREGLAVSVDVSGLPADARAVHGALIVTGSEGELTDPSSAPASVEAATVAQDGTTSFELQAPKTNLDRTQRYEVLVWKQHSPATPETIYARADVAISGAHWDTLFGTEHAEMEVGALDWGVLDRFRAYVEGPIAHGKVAVQKPAVGAGKAFRFPQVSGGTWKPGAATGSVAFGGAVVFTGHDGALDLTLSNPTVKITSAQRAVLAVTYSSTDMATGKWTRGTAEIATIDLSQAKRVAKPGGAVQWRGATAALTREGVAVFQDFYEVGQVLDPLTFTAGAASDAKPVDPPKPPTTKPGVTKPKPRPKPVAPAEGGSGKAAGSLSWGVSSAFAEYVTGPIAKGAVSTSGVGASGGAYLFPQAAGGSWNAKTRTGSVQYSGVVTFTGHKGLLSETFSNPVITVANATSGTISAGGRSFGLDLGSAARSVGANGEVTWSGVPVSGGITGGASGGSSHSLPVDGLSFTVGSASSASYGSTSVSNASKKRVAADAPPSTTGITVLTEAEKIVPGAEIEFEAAGFDAKEREILVVLYAGGGPLTLDDAAGADANGTVRWIGTLPEDVPLGEHTITLQGGTDAGAVIDVVKPKQSSKPQEPESSALAPLAADTGAAAAAGVIAPTGGMALWEWWASAGGLVVIAGCMTALVVRQRRAAS
ncbi:hypothetical protein D3248_02895 [Leucobacter zeae]|nr:hypothetical protein [Leucobacter zeae]